MNSIKYRINISTRIWTIFSYWINIVGAGVLTEYIVHRTTSLKALGGAALAAIAPVFYRYFNPADTFPEPNPALVVADNYVKGKDKESK